MTSFIVMQPPAGRDAVADARMVKDGFAVLAFLFPPLWLAWHRMWLEAALALAAGIALSLAGERLGLGVAAPALSLLLSIFVGLEGRALFAASLRRRGWTQWGVVDVDDRDEAELRYGAGLEDEAESPNPPGSVRPHSFDGFGARRQLPGPALGLLAYPPRT